MGNRKLRRRGVQRIVSMTKRFILKKDVYMYLPYLVRIESGSVLHADNILNILFEVKSSTDGKTFNIIPPEQAKDYLEVLI
jgi:hypothetical protein